MFVVRYTKLRTVTETEGSFLTAAQSTAGQRGDGAEELMWRQALLPLCLTVAHHLFPIYCSVSLMISLPPFSDGILQDGVPFRQACSPLIQLFFGFASDIDQTNTYRDIRDGNWLSNPVWIYHCRLVENTLSNRACVSMRMHGTVAVAK